MKYKNVNEVLCIQRSTNSTSVSWVYDFSSVCMCVPSFSLLKQAMHLQVSLIQSFVVGH